uniref:Nodule-specific cysteine-rich peptide L38 n=1 Tax=Lens culinaris TaxID=3864 RepID=A0A7T8DV87_LENCU|nr:nodule-specific cysteine-rich peptide L38 [Lens culinaris]
MEKKMAEIFKFVHILTIFFSHIVLVTSDNKIFCYTTDDCDSNICGKAFVMRCRLFLCLCELPKK